MREAEGKDEDRSAKDATGFPRGIVPIYLCHVWNGTCHSKMIVLKKVGDPMLLHSALTPSTCGQVQTSRARKT